MGVTYPTLTPTSLQELLYQKHEKKVVTQKITARWGGLKTNIVGRIENHSRLHIQSFYQTCLLNFLIRKFNLQQF